VCKKVMMIDERKKLDAKTSREREKKPRRGESLPGKRRGGGKKSISQERRKGRLYQGRQWDGRWKERKKRQNLTWSKKGGAGRVHNGGRRGLLF